VAMGRGQPVIVLLKVSTDMKGVKEFEGDKEIGGVGTHASVDDGASRGGKPLSQSGKD